MKANVYGGKLTCERVNIKHVVKLAKKLGIKVGKTEDESESRAKGLCVRMAELDNQQTFDGYCGPMWDRGCLRYETWEIYDILSRD